MIDHLWFNKACWIEKTNDVATKLNNYNNLSGFKKNILNSAGNYAPPVGDTSIHIKIKIKDDGSIEIDNANTGAAFRKETN